MSRAFKLSGVTFTATGLPSLFDPSFLAPNLVGWWAADQGLTVNGSNQVTAWTDLSGAGNTLGNTTPANSLVVTTGVQNSLPAIACPTLTPAAEYCVQSAAAIPGTAFVASSPFSIFMVIKRQATTNSYRPSESLIQNNATSTYNGWSLSLGSGYNNTICYRMVAQPGGYSILVHGSTQLQNGTAYEVTVTVDGSGKAAGVQIYVNGVPETMTTIVDNLSGTVANGPLVIGGGANSAMYDADFICEAAVISTKLTSTQLTALHGYALAKWLV